MRAVLDTNVYVSALWTDNGVAAEILRRWRAQEFELVVSTRVLAELRMVIDRPKFAWLRKQRADTVLRLMQLLWRHAMLIDNVADVPLLECDPADAIFLSLAVTAAADFIVSGDKHLLDLGAYDRIPILTPAQFLDILSAARPTP